MAGDRKRVTTLWECLCLIVYGLGFLLYCVNLVLAKQGENASYLNPGMRSSSSHHLIGKNILPEMKKGTKSI